MAVRRKEIIATLNGMYERPLQRIDEIRERVEKQSFGPRGTDVCNALDLIAMLLSMENDVVAKYEPVKKSFMPHGDTSSAEKSDYMEVVRGLFTFHNCPPMLLYQVSYTEVVSAKDGVEYTSCGEQYFAGLDDAMNCFHRRIAARNPRESVHMKQEIFPSEIGAAIRPPSKMKMKADA